MGGRDSCHAFEDTLYKPNPTMLLVRGPVPAAGPPSFIPAEDSLHYVDASGDAFVPQELTSSYCEVADWYFVRRAVRLARAPCPLSVSGDS